MESSSNILVAVDEIEDNLYYFSDVISAGIPDIERLITDNILQLLIFPLLLPSLITEAIRVQNFLFPLISRLPHKLSTILSKLICFELIIHAEQLMQYLVVMNNALCKN